MKFDVILQRTIRKVKQLIKLGQHAKKNCMLYVADIMLLGHSNVEVCDVLRMCALKVKFSL